jgi:cell division protein FtsW
MTIGSLKLEGDRSIWILTIIFMAFSTAVAFSSGTNNLVSDVVKRFILCLIGLGIIYKVHQIDFRIFARLSKFILLLAFFIQGITYLVGMVQSNDAARAIPIFGITFMTSDLMKFTAVIWMAVVIAKQRDQIKTLKDLLRALIYPALICAAVVPANFSSAAIILVVVFGMLMISRFNFLMLVKSFLIISITGIVLIFVYHQIGIGRLDTAKSRIYSSGLVPEDIAEKLNLKPEKSDLKDKRNQPELALMAIATSNVLFGKGPGNSDVQYFLSQLNSDFSFTLIIEEYGLIWSVLLLILYLSFIYRLLMVAKKLPLGFSAYLLIGFSLLISIQALVNVIVSTGTGPVTGQPMPLISHGGSSLLFTCLSIGICQSIIKEYKEKGLQLEREEDV